MNSYVANDILLVSKILLGYEEALWSKKVGDKLCQSNFDKRLSAFGSFLVISINYISFYKTTKTRKRKYLCFVSQLLNQLRYRPVLHLKMTVRVSIL